MTTNKTIREQIHEELQALPEEFRKPIYDIAVYMSFSDNELQFNIRYAINLLIPAINKYRENLNK